MSITCVLSTAFYPHYSPKTIKAYTFVARDLYAYFKKPPRELYQEEIKKYLLAKQEKGLSSQI